MKTGIVLGLIVVVMAVASVSFLQTAPAAAETEQIPKTAADTRTQPLAKTNQTTGSRTRATPLSRRV